MKLLPIDIKNKVLESMMRIIDRDRTKIIEENKKDLEAFNREDQALFDRLVVNESKIDEMITAIKKSKTSKRSCKQRNF